MSSATLIFVSLTIFSAVDIVSSAVTGGMKRATLKVKRWVTALEFIEMLVLAGLILVCCCCCCCCLRRKKHSCGSCSCCGHSELDTASTAEDSKAEADIEMPEPVPPTKRELCIGDYKTTAQENRVRFNASRVLAHYGTQTTCWTCFQQTYGLNRNVVKNLYTDDCLYRRLNNALVLECQDQNVVMFAQVLAEAVYQVVETLPEVVYRGVPDLNLDDYANNVGKVVYFWRFTSTSRNRNVAMRFMHTDSNKPKPPSAALFEIKLQSQRRDCVADLSKQSKYPVEQEILICCNAGFRIDKVNRENRVIYLTLVDETYCLKGQPVASLCSDHLRLAQRGRAGSGGAPTRKMPVLLPPNAKPGNVVQYHTPIGLITFKVPENARPGAVVTVSY